MLLTAIRDGSSWLSDNLSSIEFWELTTKDYLPLPPFTDIKSFLKLDWINSNSKEVTSWKNSNIILGRAVIPLIVIALLYQLYHPVNRALERVARIELASSTWKVVIVPINYTRKIRLIRLSIKQIDSI